MAQRLESRKLLTFFFQLSEIVLNRGGRVHWDRMPWLEDWRAARLFRISWFPACAFQWLYGRVWFIWALNKAPKSAFYPITMCESIVSSLFPEIYHKFVPSMSCVPRTETPVHVPKELSLSTFHWASMSWLTKRFGNIIFQQSAKPKRKRKA